MLRITLLGPVRAEHDGRDLPLGGPKPRAVLALLALAAPRTCSAEQLIDGLYGQDPPATARNAIQVNVTGLRKALADSDVRIERVGDGYTLTGAVLIDVAEFETRVSEGRTALRAGDPGRAVDTLRAALTVWGGHPFEGVGAAAFVESARPQLEATRSNALVDLAEAELRIGGPAQAAGTAQALIDQHPYDERGWIALATANYWAGQQDRALDACRRARDVLLEELGVDPTTDLADLETQILNHELADRRIATTSAPLTQQEATPKLPSLPELFVGRDALAEQIVGLIDEGRRLVTLVGIGGIGKTTLAVAAAHQLADRGIRVVPCRLETAPDATTALARVCRTLGLEVDEDPLQALTDAQPDVVLMLDNVEQVRGVGHALDELLSRVEGVRILTTSRRPTRARHEHAVTVAPLEPGSAEQLFRHHAERVRPGVTGGEPGPIRELCALLDGIPLALELAAGRVRALTPQQLLSRIEDQRASVLDGPTVVSTPVRQSSLGGVLQEAYDALGGSAQSLFALLGCCDGWISLELLEAVAAGWVPEFVDAVDELVACGLVTLDATGRARMRGLIREFAASMGPRAELEARLVAEAAALAERISPQLFGGTAQDALAEVARDGDTLRQALSLAVASGDAAHAATLVLGLNRAWLLTGRIAEGSRWIQSAATMPGHSAEASARLAILTGTYASYVNQADAQHLLEEALEQAARVDLPIDRIVVNGWCCLAAYSAHHGDFGTADRAAAIAGDLAARSADPRLIALARDIDGHVAAYLGDHERSLAAKVAGVADARRSGDAYDVVHLMVDAASDLMYLGRLDESIAYADEAFDRLATTDPGALLGQLLLVRGSAHAAAGRLTTARADLLAALRQAHDRHPEPLVTADILYALGGCLAQLTEDIDACRCLGAAEALYAEHGIDTRRRLAAAILDLADGLRERLGADRYATMLALGAADPDRVVERLAGDGSDAGAGR